MVSPRVHTIVAQPSDIVHGIVRPEWYGIPPGDDERAAEIAAAVDGSLAARH